jgi:hypothetical protein
MHNKSMLSVTISGLPSSYSTTAEKPWKQALWQQIPAPSAGDTAALGVIAHFRVLWALEGPRAVDLDNLGEPLFSVLVNEWKWFNGRRPNLRWFSVSKSYDGEPGCDLTALASGALPLPDRDGQVRFAASYKGTLPASAQDKAFADCIAIELIPEDALRLTGERFAVALRFGSARLNIGDIGTGAVKHVVDCLYRVIGGTAGAPEDWRVDKMHVEKGAEDIPEDCIEITIRSIE